MQIRTADLLALEDPAQVYSFYSERATANPNSELDLFIAGRYAPSLADKQSMVAKILTLNASSYWGTLLQATAYSSEEDTEFAKAEAALLRAIEIDNSLTYAPALLGELWSRSGKKNRPTNCLSRWLNNRPTSLNPFSAA